MQNIDFTGQVITVAEHRNSKKNERNGPDANKSNDLAPNNSNNAPAERYCQLEVTQYKYDRDSVERVQVCVDEKSDEEILKLIKEAKKQACMSPFCGCWLG